jgi:dTMP kinase
VDESLRNPGSHASASEATPIPSHTEAAPITPEKTPLPGAGGISLDGFKDVFRIKDFRRLFWGQAISALGDWVGTLAFIVAAQRLTQQSAAVAIVLILRLLPSFFATPIGGVLSDRWDRKRIMVMSDIVRFGIIGAVPFVPHIGALYAFAFAHECFSLVFLPARDASLPNIVPRNRLEPANALIMGSSFAGIPLSGPVFAILAWTGTHFPATFHHEHLFQGGLPSFAFFFDAVTFLVSAAMIQRMNIHGPIRDPSQGSEPFFAAVREGARYIGRRPLLRGLAYAVAVAMLGGGVLFALGVGYVHDTLHGSDVQFGWLMGLFGAGMVIGFLTSQLKPPGGIKWMVRISLLIMGGVLISMGVVPVLFIAYAVAAVFGTAFSTALIVGMSAAQGRSDDAHRGRVMALVHMLVRIALSVGAISAAGIATLVPKGGLRIPLIHLHPDKNQVALVVAGTLIALGTLSVRGRETPEDEIEAA